MNVKMQSWFALVLVLGGTSCLAGDEKNPVLVVPGQKYLQQCIRNPVIPMIVDATVVGFNKKGHGEIKLHAIYRAVPRSKNDSSSANRESSGPVTVPKWIRGYEYTVIDSFVNPFTGKPRKPSQAIMALKFLLEGRPGRYLFFLDGDLLYGEGNNRFPIRQSKNGLLEVGTESASHGIMGFNPGGPPWKPLQEMVRLIPGQE